MPQDQIREMIRKIYKWLKPGGLFVFGTVPADVEHVLAQWLGTDVIVTESQYADFFREPCRVHDSASEGVCLCAEGGRGRAMQTGGDRRGAPVIRVRKESLNLDKDFLLVGHS